MNGQVCPKCGAPTDQPTRVRCYACSALYAGEEHAPLANATTQALRGMTNEELVALMANDDHQAAEEYMRRRHRD